MHRMALQQDCVCVDIQNAVGRQGLLNVSEHANDEMKKINHDLMAEKDLLILYDPEFVR